MRANLLQKKELQEAYEVAEPYDVVTPVFDENLGEINKLATFILGLYGLAENEDIDDIKN